MLLPAPVFMPAESNRGLAFPFILRGVAEGLKSEDIIRVLKEADLTYRRQDMLADIRAAREGLKVRDELAALPPSAVVDPEETALWEWKIKGGRYLYQVGLLVRDVVTGKESLEYYGVVTDSILTRREAEQMALSAFTEQAEAYGLTNVRVYRPFLSDVVVSSIRR
ncbi:MAG: hypothetical protein H5U03_00145 [Clostridia bacterium]|nr:hypothetical protein [Clostridia bacterium]